MARNPEVVEGYRGPRDETRLAAPVPPARAIPEGKTVFQFVADKYFLQLTAPVDQLGPDGRIIRGDRSKAVKADEGFAILDNVKDAEVIQMVREHPDWGRDFWDYASVLAGQKKAKQDEALKVLLDPESREVILQALREAGVDDFALPKTKTPAPKTGEAKE